MPWHKSPLTGPMSLQPVEHSSIRPDPVAANDANDLRKTEETGIKKETRAEAVRLAKARIMRRNSLRKQRQAQKR